MTQEFQQLAKTYIPRCCPSEGIDIRFSFRLSLCVVPVVLLILASCIAGSGKATRVSELKSVVISVEDLDASLKFYSEILGFKKLADVEMDSEATGKLFGVSKGTSARIVVVGREGADVGMVRLVQFKPRYHGLAQQDVKLWDLGVSYLHINVDDVDRRYQEIQTRGFAFLGPPTEWKVPEQNRTVIEALFHGPDGVIIDLLHFETGSGKRDEQRSKYSEIINAAQVVPDMDRALAFYRDILGLVVLKDQVPGNKQLDSQLQFPPGTRIRVVHLASGDRATGKIELVQFLNIRGRDLTPKPPNTGLFMLAFVVEDIEILIEDLRQNKIPVVCPPTEIGSTIYGRRKVATVQAPNGILVEFVQANVKR